MRGSFAKAAVGSRQRAQRATTPDLGDQVRALVQDARRLWSTTRRVGRELIAAELNKEHLRELPRRIDLIAEAEDAWKHQAARVTPVALREAREAGQQLKIDMISAARWLLRRDPSVVSELDRIAGATGLDDLAHQLRTLASFYDRHAYELRNADVPKEAEWRARELAAQITLLAESEQAAAVASAAARDGALARVAKLVRGVERSARRVFRVIPARATILGVEFRAAVERHEQASRAENAA